MRKDNVEENIEAGPNSIELQRIYLLASEKGNGYGRLQIEKCIELAKNDGYTTIWLGVWEKNEHALGFYKKMGFELFSDHIFDFGGDPQRDFLMRKGI